MSSHTHVKRKRNSQYMKDPGIGGRPEREQVRPSDIDMEAIDTTVAFSDWYEAVLSKSPLAKTRR